VLYVRDARRSAEFYKEAFGFVVAGEFGDGAAVFMRAAETENDHDLGLFSIGDGAGPSQAGRGTVGLYHIAWEVQTLADLREIAAKLSEAGALTGATDHSTTKALYGRDPDGLEFEVCWIVPKELQTPEIEDGRARMRALDIDAEIERFGLETVGGV
jgi:catechol-2,3-dioxygenase